MLGEKFDTLRAAATKKIIHARGQVVEAVYNKIGKDHIAEAGGVVLELTSDTRLSLQGRGRYYARVQQVKDKAFGPTTDREKTPISETIDILEPFGSCVKGLEHIAQAGHNNFLLIANHSYAGPLKGFTNAAVMNHHIRNVTGQEVQWVQIEGNWLTYPVHDAVSKALEVITVSRKPGIGARQIYRAFTRDKKTVGIFPEGKLNYELKKANPKAGRIVITAMKLGLPVVCATSWFDRHGDKKFHVTFHPQLDYIQVEKQLHTADKEFIKMYGVDPNDLAKTSELQQVLEEMRGQAVSDYAMAIVAQDLPPYYQGYYHGVRRSKIFGTRGTDSAGLTEKE